MATAHHLHTAGGEAEALARQHATLRQVIEAISSELELRPLLTSIVRHACELLNADRGTIGLVDAARNVVRTAAVYRMPETELGAEMGPGVGLAGRVLATQAPVITRYGELEEALHEDVLDDAVIGMPIWWRGEMIGFFGIGASPPHRFSGKDVDLLALFSRHAAIAIGNARQFEAEKRRRARMATLGRIGHMIAQSLSVETILSTAVRSINEQLGYDTVGLMLVSPEDPERLVLHGFCRTGMNLEIGDHSQRIGEGVIGRAAASRSAVLVNDVRADPDYVPIPGGEHLVSELAVPIAIGERLLGVLNVESDVAIGDEEVEGLKYVANQLGIAIENGRLFGQTQTALADVELLYETSRRMSMAMDIESVVDAYLEHVAVLGRYVCSVGIFGYDDSGQPQVSVVGRWSPEQGLAHPEELYFQRDATLDPVLIANETVIIADVETDPRVSEALRNMQREVGRPALAAIPLVIRGRRIGVVVLAYREPHEWSATDLKPFEITAAQLAATIRSRQQQQRLLAHDQQLAVLEERQRLARELHDSVSQLIFSMTLIAQSVGTAWAADPREGERRVGRLLELARSARTEMRALLVELSPAESSASEAGPLAGAAQVEQHGLVAALERHLDGVPQENLVCTLHAADYAAQSHALEAALFRIAQEAVNNVIKHAEAHRLEMSLACADGRVRLSIADDGRGFRVGAAVSSNVRFGLQNMRERAEALGGDFSLETSPGAGTRVTVELPVSAEREERTERGL